MIWRGSGGQTDIRKKIITPINRMKYIRKNLIFFKSDLAV